MFRRLSFSRCRLFSVAIAVMGLAVLSEAAAQTRWQETIQVIVPVQENEMIGALVDSITTVFQERGTSVRRSPQGEPMPYPQLVDTLEADGLSPFSASHAFITYRYRLTSAELETQIVDLYFIYRPPGPQEDLSIFYLDLEASPLYEELLVQRGTEVPNNEMVLLPFEQQLSFHRLAQQARIVRLGDEIVRDPERAAAEKERILEITARLAHEGM